MKKFMFLVIVVISSAMSLNAQTSKESNPMLDAYAASKATPSNPNANTTGMSGERFNGDVYLVTEEGTFIPLEKKSPEQKYKRKYFGVGGYESSKYFKGERSSVRITSISPLFSVKMPGLQGQDPSQFIHLKKLTVDQKDGGRVLELSSMKPFGHSKFGENEVELNFMGYDGESFKFRPLDPLEPGREYAVSANGFIMKSFLFGVDTK